MLDYSLLKLQVKQALEELQPMKVQVIPLANVKTSLLKTVMLETGFPQNAASPPLGKQWEILSGVIHHHAGLLETRFNCTQLDHPNLAVFFTDFLAPAAADSLTPVDFMGARVFLRSNDEATLLTGNAGDQVFLRVLETDV